MANPNLRVMTAEELAAGRAKAKEKREAKKSWRANHAGIDKLAARHPNYAGDIAKLRGGSMKSAIRLACIDCSGGSYNEVKACTATACALYTFRPGSVIEHAS